MVEIPRQVLEEMFYELCGRCWFSEFVRLNLLILNNVFKQCKSKLIEMDRIKWHSDMFNDTGHVNYKLTGYIRLL